MEIIVMLLILYQCDAPWWVYLITFALLRGRSDEPVDPYDH
jgi:hypothetical protein